MKHNFVQNLFLPQIKLPTNIYLGSINDSEVLVTGWATQFPLTRDSIHLSQLNQSMFTLNQDLQFILFNTPRPHKNSKLFQSFQLFKAI